MTRQFGLYPSGNGQHARRPTHLSAIAIVAGTAMAVLGMPGDAQAATCGANNQRPCNLWERFPSCNPGLTQDFLKGRCLPSKPLFGPPMDAQTRRADEVIKAHARTAEKLRGVSSCLGQAAHKHRFVAAVKARNADLASRIVHECLDSATLAAVRVIPAAARKHLPASGRQANTGGQQCHYDGYNTISVGLIGPSVAVHFGASIEVGVAFDLNPCSKLPARIYETHATSAGTAINIGIDALPISLGMSPVRKGKSRSDGWVAAGKFVAGASLGYWVDRDTKKYDGFSVAFGIGIGFDLFSKHRSETNIF